MPRRSIRIGGIIIHDRIQARIPVDPSLLNQPLTDEQKRCLDAMRAAAKTVREMLTKAGR